MTECAQTAAAIAVSLFAANAAAAPMATGERVPPAKAKSLDGAVLDTHALNGKIVVVFYEDKDSTKTNEHVKTALKLQKVNGRQATNVAIYAVANVSGYDWFPASRFVKRAIRKEQRRYRQPIFLDWSGKFGRALRFRDKTSNLLVIDRDGRVLLAHTGRANDGVVKRILAATRALAPPPPLPAATTPPPEPPPP